MLAQGISLLVILGSVALAQSDAPQAPSTPRQTDPPRADRRGDERRRDDRRDDDRRGNDRRNERRRERGDQWERFRNATPAQRAEMRMERMVDMSARMYELDDTQRVMVKNEIAQMQAERRVQMGEDAEQYDKLREQMFEFWSRPQREDSQADDSGRDDWESRRERMREMRRDPQFRELRDQMRTMEQKYPIDWDAAAQRVEALLPPEQAEKGRERRMQWLARRDDRRDGGRFGRRPTAVAGDAVTAPQAPTPGTQQPQAIVAPQAPAGQAGPDANAPAPAPKPLHPWEQFVRRFTDQHDLSSAQANAAMAILHDLQARAAQIEKAQANRVAETELIRDPVKREQRLKELRGPKDELFTELKHRLDGLLTAEQRQRVGK